MDIYFYQKNLVRKFWILPHIHVHYPYEIPGCKLVYSVLNKGNLPTQN